MRVRVPWLRNASGYAPHRPVVIEVPPGPDTRPGERIIAPSHSILPPMPLGSDGSREDFRVLVGPANSSFAAVCLGPVHERGTPEAAAHLTIAALQQRGMRLVDAPIATRVAQEPAFRYRVAVPQGDLTEWKFEHGGWLFTTGLLRRSDPLRIAIKHVDEIHESWTWLEPPTREPLEARRC